ncbi:pentapeptide repeat-containing protein [Nocardia sp. NBC_01009]|uniref:pentapeptide repeat-containing protein n=1 Tax=Nocardia sp. NBC_01009 TaxID=2975996 RepID=UPI00386E6CE1|nr:pentapeptide repeat-containing protein [Nocardia sp. NBC_01009]
MPRELADLPYASYLKPLEGPLEQEGDYDCVQVSGADIDDVEAGHARFSEAVFTSLSINRGSMRYSRFADVWVRNVRWVGTELADTSWQDAELIEGAMSGVDAGGANLRRVRFEGCKFDSVNFRRAKFRDVSFVDCVVRHTDFGDAELTNVTFPGTVVQGLLLNRARLKKFDLRDAVSIGIADGIDALRGATISSRQLMDLAPDFARAIGINVVDS